MRSAFCLYGKVGGRTGKDGIGGLVDYRACHQSLYENIISLNECDVFMHCWNVSLQYNLESIYKPKLSKFESQIKFTTVNTGRPGFDEYITRSRWYSTQEVIALKSLYEKRNNFIYDWVILCRYDLLFFVPFVFGELENKYLYLSNWNQGNFKGRQPDKTNCSLKNERFLIEWILGSSHYIDRIAEIFEKFYTYSLYSYTDPHRMAWEHITTFLNLDLIRYIFYRWWDYELYRIKICGWKSS